MRQRRARYTALGEAACALNPLLRTVRDRLAFALERWADEDAPPRAIVNTCG